jgi:putative tryptophan/tyrosine transport system substrate-binding protein
MAEILFLDWKILVRRRNFLTGALALPLIGLERATGQTAAKPLEIGFAYEGITPAGAVRAKAFQEGLRSKGYDEGRNIVTVIRNAESKQGQFEPIVRELVQREVRVLLAIGPAMVRLAHAATKSTPIVALDLESDPIKDGLVQNISRPGGNLTGMFFDFPDFARKWLQLLAEAVPNLHRLTVFWDTSTGKYQVDAVADEARARGITLQLLQVASPADFEPSFTAAVGNKADALLVMSSPLFGTKPQLIADLAIQHRLPAIMFYPEFARVGGLLAYGTNLIDLFFQAGVLVAKILDGDRPATLPVERPSRFQLVANLKTAALLGVTIPTSILLRADEVIE